MARSLPRVLTGIIDRGGVAIPHRCDRCQKVCLVAERNLALLLHHLEGQNDISGFILYLPLKLDFRVMTQNK